MSVGQVRRKEVALGLRHLPLVNVMAFTLLVACRV